MIEGGMTGMMTRGRRGVGQGTVMRRGAADHLMIVRGKRGEGTITMTTLLRPLKEGPRTLTMEITSKSLPSGGWGQMGVSDVETHESSQTAACRSLGPIPSDDDRLGLLRQNGLGWGVSRRWGAWV